MKKYFLLYFFVLFINLPGFSQENSQVDSLKKIAEKATNDSVKLKALAEITEQCDINELDKYAVEGLSIAEKMLENKKHDTLFILENKQTLINNRGFAAQQLTDVANALTYYYQALDLAEKLKNKEKTCATLLNIGSLFRLQDDSKKAFDVYSRAYEIAKTTTNKQIQGSILNDIGLCYSNLKKTDKALEKYNEALKIYTEIGDSLDMAVTYNNIGIEIQMYKKIEDALVYFNRSLDIRKKIRDELGIGQSLMNIANAKFKLNLIDGVEENLKQAVDIYKKMGVEAELFSSYLLLGKVYYKKGKFKESVDMYRLYLENRERITSEALRKESFKKDLQHEYEKKEEMAKADQEKKELIAKEEKKQQQLIIYSISAGLAMVLIFALFAYRAYRQKQKSNVELERKNILIERQKKEVEHQKEIVDEKQKEILDSIHYAKRIQRAVITSDTYISQYVKDYFVYYQPKDIVSGDFYWALHANNKFYLATADCTGHGVPGAFMSLLNISILNEVMIEKKIARADLILNEARKDIIKSLNPTGSEESKDGMDCILACFDFENLKLEYAAANNSFYIVRDNQLITCAADKMPVGKSPRDTEPFTLHTVDLHKGDTVYMLTDGLPDQFGGPKGKKYKYKQLEDLLIANNEKPLAKQREILSTSFSSWKGNLEQVDDVLLIGIKI
jgi:serine phosphatase RsbU (regulator of sigma subunit)